MLFASHLAGERNIHPASKPNETLEIIYTSYWFTYGFHITNNFNSCPDMHFNTTVNVFSYDTG